MFDSLPIKILPKKLPPIGNFKWLSNLHKSEIYKSDNRHWLADKYVDKPSPSDIYTVGQMEEMGMVGIYAEDN